MKRSALKNFVWMPLFGLLVGCGGEDKDSSLSEDGEIRSILDQGPSEVLPLPPQPFVPQQVPPTATNPYIPPVIPVVPLQMTGPLCEVKRNHELCKDFVLTYPCAPYCVEACTCDLECQEKSRIAKGAERLASGRLLGKLATQNKLGRIGEPTCENLSALALVEELKTSHLPLGRINAAANLSKLVSKAQGNICADACIIVPVREQLAVEANPRVLDRIAQLLVSCGYKVEVRDF